MEVMPYVQETADRFAILGLLNGGLDMAVEAVTGGETVWVSDIDPGACKILAHHHPDVPNLGDISTIDWTKVQPVEVLTGGFPCQDVSMAGRRAGMKPGTRSGLWQMMAAAIDNLRPGLVVIENVRGLLSADGNADVEPCPWCMGNPDDEPALRALGGVLGDLADLGYDAAWHGLRAADVGAPHGRFRIFIIAWPATDPDPIGWDGRPGVIGAGWWGQPTDSGHVDADPTSQRLPTGRDDAREPEITEPFDRGSSRQPAPTADPGGGGRERRRPDGVRGPRDAVTGGGQDPCQCLDDPRQQELVRPRPGSRRVPAGGLGVDTTEGGPGEGMPGMRGTIRPATIQWPVGGPDQIPRPADMLAAVRELPDGGHEGGPSLAGPAAPGGILRGMRDDGGSPRSSHRPEPCERCGREPGDPVRVVSSAVALAGGPGQAHGCDTNWGPFESAIRRWEPVIGRVAPPPTEAGPKGGQRLSPVFVEFMMGLPDGWVTGVPGIDADKHPDGGERNRPYLTRNEQLKALGNGVVPQQAEAALRHLLSVLGRAS